MRLRGRPWLGITLPAALLDPGGWGLLLTTASIEFARGALFIAILPGFLSEQRHLSAVDVGMVVSSQFLADIVCKTLGGAIADRYGPWPILLPTLAASALAAALIPHATTLGGLMLLAVLFGVGGAVNWPAATAGITRMGADGTEGRALSVIFIAWLGGGGLGPVISSFLSVHGYARVFHIVTAVALVAPLTALVALLLHLHPGPSRRSQRTSQTSVLHHLREVRLILPPLFLQAGALGMLLPVVEPFTHQVLHLPNTAFGMLLLIGGAGCVASLPLFGSLVDRYGYRWFLIGGLTGAGLGTAVLAASQGTADLLLRALFIGVSYAAILPAWNKLLVNAVPEALRGTFMGFFMAIEGVGVAIGPTVGGALWSSQGPRTPFFGAAVIIIAMAIYYLVVPLRPAADAA